MFNKIITYIYFDDDVSFDICILYKCILLSQLKVLQLLRLLILLSSFYRIVATKLCDLFRTKKKKKQEVYKGNYFILSAINYQ